MALGRSNSSTSWDPLGTGAVSGLPSSGEMLYVTEAGTFDSEGKASQDS